MRKIRVKDLTSGDYHLLDENTPTLARRWLEDEEAGGVELEDTHPDALELEYRIIGERCLIRDNYPGDNGRWTWWLSEVVESDAHAPGPWTKSGTAKGDYAIRSAEGRCLFTMYKADEHTATANACLIESAPELLAILEAYLENPCLGLPVEEVRRLVDKARGRGP